MCDCADVNLDLPGNSCSSTTSHLRRQLLSKTFSQATKNVSPSSLASSMAKMEESFSITPKTSSTTSLTNFFSSSQSRPTSLDFGIDCLQENTSTSPKTGADPCRDN